jgi:hypothetical protein
MRSLLGVLVKLGLDVTSTVVERIFDVDRGDDRDDPSSFVTSERRLR